MKQSSGVTGGRDEKAADVGRERKKWKSSSESKKATNKERVGAVAKGVMGELKMEGKNDGS